MCEKNKVVISIIVVSLNTNLKLKATINSIRKQSYNKFEVIVIDGLSKDESIETIHKNKDILNKYLIEKDDGIYDAMNKGINLAKGTWTIFLNSGDIFHDENILLNFSKILEKKNEDVIHADTVVRNENMKYNLYSKKFNHKTHRIPFCHQSSFTKTSILSNNLFNLKYKLSSDFDLFLRLYKQKKIFTKVNMVIAEIESGGLSDVNRFRVLKENFDILKTNKMLTISRLTIIFDFIYLFISKIIKILIPKKFLNYVLKLKYYLLQKIKKNNSL